VLSTIAHALLKERSLLQVSHPCHSCDARTSWYDTIPIISYVFLGGKCRYCTSPQFSLYNNFNYINPAFAYAALDFIGAVILTSHFFLEIVIFYSASLLFFTKFLFISILFISIRTDLQELSILRASSLYFVPVWFFFATINFLEINLYTSFFGAILGYFIPWIVGRLYYFLRRVDGIGEGDFELLAMIGAFLGPIRMIYSMALGSGLAISVVLVFAVLFSTGRNIRIPFGPFLAAGAIFELFR
jgi:leader peptidase (prepilin peptidase)/N-methyltransferase